jgi:hypothetical protein
MDYHTIGYKSLQGGWGEVGSPLNEILPVTVTMDLPISNLPPIQDPKVGVYCFRGDRVLVWRMNSFVYQYPSVCEHATFPASMIVRGHGKLFVNPRLIFRYGGLL